MQNKQILPSVIRKKQRYTSSIPQGKISQLAISQVPIITKKGTYVGQSININKITDQNVINKKLKSLSLNQSYQNNQYKQSIQNEKKQKNNINFLKYKFNPDYNHNQEDDNEDQISKNKLEDYGTIGKAIKEKVNINIFYEHKNVLFQDQRAPIVYKKLFIEKEEQIN